jgi:hypothetical protein
VDALSSGGYIPTRHRNGSPRFALYDHEFGHNGYGINPTVSRFIQSGVPVFLYPHSTRPPVYYDGVFEYHPKITMRFTIAQGHVDVMKKIGYPVHMEVLGWPYCEILPFRSIGEVRNILFAPIHPTATGFLPEVDKDVNARSFSRVFEYAMDKGIHLKVRHIQSLENNGMTWYPGVEYLEGKPDGTYSDIDCADLVFAHQTFKDISISRGCPVIAMGEDVPAHNGTPPEDTRFVKNWDVYAEDMMFPLDVLNTGLTMDGLVRMATESECYVSDWKSRFIGKPLDPALVVSKLEKFL